jgi:hypothetical protein
LAKTAYSVNIFVTNIDLMQGEVLSPVYFIYMQIIWKYVFF